MNTNEILIKLKYALNMEDTEMIEIFAYGDVDVSNEQLQKMLNFQEDDNDSLKVNNSDLESFLNGYIIFKRGKQEAKPGQVDKAPLAIVDAKNLNNIVMKKLKIALSLSSQDMLDIFSSVNGELTKGELSNLFRKEGHKHYKRCNDKVAIDFLDGLAKRFQQ